MSLSAGVVVRRCLLAVATCGLIVFAGLWTLSMTRPHLIEASARTLLLAEVERRTQARIDTLSDETLSGLARTVMADHARETEQLRRLRDTVADRVRSTVDAMADADCRCRAGLQDPVRAGIDARLERLAGWDARLDALVEGAYAHTAARVQREVRIFAGTNAMAFLVLGVIAWRRRAATLQLLVPAAVLLGSVGVSASLYLFNQDWVRTVFFNDYLGYGYVAWLGVLLALLADILVNRARVTTRIINAVLHAAGSAVTALPC